jgi:outer membrane biosynthesis protein TonB
LSITINRECSWSVRTDADWLGIASSSASGQGNGSVAYTVAPNAVVTVRRANLLVNDQSLAVQQAAAACVYSVDRSQKSFDAAGGAQVVGVSAQSGCPWTAQSHAPWLDVAAGTSGSGNGTVTMVATGNSGTDSRSSSLTIANQTVMVQQAGVVAPPTSPTPAPTPEPAPPTPSPTPAPTPAPPAPAPTPGPTPAPTPTPPAPSPSPSPAPTPTPSPTPTPPAPAPSPSPSPTPTPAPSPDPNAVTLEGAVSGLKGDCPLLSFKVSGQEIHTLPTTNFTGGNCSKLKNKQKVSVTGLLQVGNFVLASRVELQD